MGMITRVCVLISVILLAVIVLRNPDQENKTLIAALIAFQVLLLVLDFIWV